MRAWCTGQTPAGTAAAPRPGPASAAPRVLSEGGDRSSCTCPGWLHCVARRGGWGWGRGGGGGGGVWVGGWTGGWGDVARKADSATLRAMGLSLIGRFTSAANRPRPMEMNQTMSYLPVTSYR